MCRGKDGGGGGSMNDNLPNSILRNAILPYANLPNAILPNTSLPKALWSFRSIIRLQISSRYYKVDLKYLWTI